MFAQLKQTPHWHDFTRWLARTTGISQSASRHALDAKSDVVVLQRIAAATHHQPEQPANDGRALSRIRDILPDIPASVKDYLDIGCAEGRITAAVAVTLSLSPEHAHACDVLPINMGDEKAPDFTFARAPAEQLPYTAKSFDLLTMFMSAHHFSDIHAALAEAHRVLRPGARLIMREHDLPTPSRSLYYDAIHAVYAVMGKETTPEEFVTQWNRGTYARYMHHAGWVAAAEAAGFKLVSQHLPTVRGKPRRDAVDSVYLVFDAV